MIYVFTVCMLSINKKQYKYCGKINGGYSIFLSPGTSPFVAKKKMLLTYNLKIKLIRRSDLFIPE